MARLVNAWLTCAKETFVAQEHCRHFALAPETDGKADGLHGVRMSTNEEASKEDPAQIVPAEPSLLRVASFMCADCTLQSQASSSSTSWR
jgi:hypothetical protein